MQHPCFALARRDAGLFQPLERSWIDVRGRFTKPAFHFFPSGQPRALITHWETNQIVHLPTNPKLWALKTIPNGGPTQLPLAEGNGENHCGLAAWVPTGSASDEQWWTEKAVCRGIWPTETHSFENLIPRSAPFWSDPQGVQTILHFPNSPRSASKDQKIKRKSWAASGLTQLP